MPPPAVEFAPVEFTWIPPTSDLASACSTSGGSAASVTSRQRFVKVKRHFKSSTVSNDQQSSASDSCSSAPAGFDRVKTNDSNVCSSGVESLGISSSCEHGFVSNGRDSSGPVFGSSQFHEASNFKSESKEISEQFGKLNFGDNWKMKAEAATFNFHSEGNLKPDNGLASCMFIFKGNTQRSSIHDESRGAKSSDDIGKSFDVVGRGTTSNVHSQVVGDAALNLGNGTGASRLCHSDLPAASVGHIKIPHIEVQDAAENDNRSKMADKNIFVFGSGCNLSSQSDQTSSWKPSLFMSNADPSCLQTNLFSEQTEEELRENNSAAGRETFEKKGKPMGMKQYFPEESNAEENSSTSDCYSPMDFSPYHERTVDAPQSSDSSLEKQTNEALSSNYAPNTYTVVDDIGISGDRSGDAASGSIDIDTVSATQTAAHQPESDRVCSNSFIDKKVQFCFSSGLEKSEQGSFAFSSSASQGKSSLRSKHQHRKSNVSTSQAATMEDASCSLRRGESGCTSDIEGSRKEAPRGVPMISKKLRPRLVKLRKHSHGRSESASTQQKEFISNPIPAVSDGLFQVELNYADSSTAHNSAEPEVTCSFKDAGSIFGGSNGTCVSKFTASEEEFSSSECGKRENIASFSDANFAGLQSTSQFYSGEAIGVKGSVFGDEKVFGYSNGISSFCDSEPTSKCEMDDIGEKNGNLSSCDSEKGRTGVECGFIFGAKRSPFCGESSAAKDDHGTRPNSKHFGGTVNIPCTRNHGLDVSGKDKSYLSCKLSDGMQKLDIHEVEKVDGNQGNKSQQRGETPFVFRSGTEVSDTNADCYPSPTSDQIKNPSTGLCTAEERPRQMQFSFASDVDNANQGSFVFSASTSVGLNSPRRKHLHKKRSSVHKASVSFVSNPKSNSSTTLPAETTSTPRGDASYVREYEDKSCLNGQETCEQKEASSLALTQEACEKWRFRGNQAYKNGQFSRAERFYTKGIDSVPSHETSGCCLKPLLLCYSNRAATRMSVGRLREAIDDCTRAAVLDPNFLKVQIRAANCHLVLGEIENAMYCFRKCLESGANICLDRRLIIEAADGLQKAQKVAEYTKLLEEKSPDAESRAMEILSEAMSISKFSEKLLRMKAEALYMSRKYEEVIQHCEQSLIIAEKNLPTSDVPKRSENEDDSECEGKLTVRLWRFFWMAKSNFCLGRLQEALDLLQKVERTGCSSDRSLSEFMASAISLSTTIRKLLDFKNSGNEAFRLKKYTEAVEHYTTALSSCGESRPFAAICFCNRAAAHQALGQIADAIADCSLAISLDGNYAKAVSRRATLHELIRHYEQAASDDCRLIKILQSQSNQKTRTSGGATDRANQLKKAYKHKSSMEEEAKRETPLDLYLILGVEKSDEAADIKKAYRKAALRHHPDKAGQFLRSDSSCEGWLWKEIAELVHEDADWLFKIIGKAYAVLSDTEKRAQYDLEEEIRKTPKVRREYSSHYRESSDYYGYPSWRSNGRRYGQENWKTYGNSSSRW